MLQRMRDKLAGVAGGNARLAYTPRSMSRFQNRTAVSLSVIFRATIGFGSGPHLEASLR